MSEIFSPGLLEGCAFRRSAESLWRARAVRLPICGMVDPLDIHAYNLDTRYKRRYRKMIGFLRKNHEGSEGLFFRVDVTLEGGEKVGLYFLKRNLYLQGWSILPDDSGTTVERYLAVGKTPLPEGLADEGPSVGIRIRYAADAVIPDLSAAKLQEDLLSLHAYLTRLLLQGNNPPPPWNNAERAFHSVVRMTSEMARFGGFCKSFTDAWPKPWPQSTVIAPASGPKPPFSWAVNEWDGLSRKACRSDDSPIFNGRAVTLAEAEEIMEGGVLWR